MAKLLGSKQSWYIYKLQYLFAMFLTFSITGTSLSASTIDCSTESSTLPGHSLLPESFYDHVHDRAYIQLQDKDGNPSGQYRAIDAIDPNMNNRKFRTIKEPANPNVKRIHPRIPGNN